MIYFLRVMWAEARKQHRDFFHRPITYFTMVIFPMLDVITAIYIFKPFIADGANSNVLKSYIGDESIETFLIIGYLGYNIFFSLIQSAWRFADERSQGTLELMLLTPANRFAIVLGNAAASLIQSIWMFTIVAGFAIAFLIHQWSHINIPLLLLGYTVSLIAATIWGGLLNSFFLLTRDPGLFFTILQSPLEFFGGVRFPVNVLPDVLRYISRILPLTYCLIILRKLTLLGGGLDDILPDLLILFILIILMACASRFLIYIAERHAKQAGTLTFF